MCVCTRADLLAHAVDAIGPQQVDRLLHQVGAATVEHPEAQVLQELGLSGGGIQLPGGTKTVLGSAEGRDGGRGKGGRDRRWERRREGRRDTSITVMRPRRWVAARSEKAYLRN